jgi:uncharacterized protein
MSAELQPPLDPGELRVLATLSEKEIATPEYYPLSLNSLTTACNQKTNREPVTSFTEDEVRDILDRLRHRGLAFSRTGAGSRVEKFGSRLQEQFNFGRGELAILIELMLRGPQTVGELRTRTERMHRFEDTDQVEYSLSGLAGRSYVRQLARHPGIKEPRWAQLLSGEPPADLGTVSERPAAPREDRLGALESQVAQLSAEVAALREQVSDLLKQLS